MPTALEQKRINSVVMQNSLISKPDKPTDKYAQTGISLIVNRGHPDHCILCGKRHSCLACPLWDPVAEIIPSCSTYNPDNVTVRTPISKCKACIVVSCRKEIIDGVYRTSKDRKLCPIHLLQNSAPDTSPS